MTVPDNSITFFSATATDAAWNKSACSSPTSYLEQTPEFEVINEEQIPGVEIPIAPVQEIPSGGEITHIPQASLHRAPIDRQDPRAGEVDAERSPLHARQSDSAESKKRTQAAAAGRQVLDARRRGTVNLTLGSKPKRKKQHH